jgi:hypothetical protein
MKHYTLTDNDLEGWMENNRQEIHLLILEAIHEAQKRSDYMLDFVNIDIACINAKDHTVNIGVKDEAEAIDALHKCLSYFVKTEQFEQAIVARDCLKYYTAFY